MKDKLIILGSSLFCLAIFGFIAWSCDGWTLISAILGK